MWENAVMAWKIAYEKPKTVLVLLSDVLPNKCRVFLWELGPGGRWGEFFNGSIGFLENMAKAWEGVQNARCSKLLNMCKRECLQEQTS